MSSYGKRFVLTLFGEDAAPFTGAVVDGVPAGTPIDNESVNTQLMRYGDLPAFRTVSGLYEGKTTGAPLCALFANEGSAPEASFIARPGMPDDLWFTKSHGSADVRGDGHFSAKLHAPLIFAGTVARTVLESKGITLCAHIKSLAGVEDASFSELPLNDETFTQIGRGKLPVYDKRKEMLMALALEQAKNNADTLGGQIECVATGLPVALGSPLFDGIESKLASVLFSFMDVRGVSFGDVAAKGSENNDELFIDTLEGRPAARSNHAGGAVGGLTNGMPLIFTAALRPSPIIGIEQTTVDFKHRHSATLPPMKLSGTTVPQYAVLIESAAAIAIVDALIDK